MNRVAFHVSHLVYGVVVCGVVEYGGLEHGVGLVLPTGLVARSRDLDAWGQDGVGLDHGEEVVPLVLDVAENGGFVSLAEDVGLDHGEELTPMDLVAGIGGLDASPMDGLRLARAELVAVVQTILD